METMSNLTLLVLAAGAGSRYGGLKQFEPVGPHDETIMEYSIFDAHRAGFSKIVFVIRKDKEEAFKHAVRSKFEKRIPIDYVFQEPGKLTTGFSVPEGRTKPWGTTHAILMAANLVHEPFAVINADDFYGAASFRALANHLQSGTPDYSMMGFTLRNTLSEFGSVSRGVCHVDEEGYLKDITELRGIEREGMHITNTDDEGKEANLTGSEVVSMNMWGFTPQAFPQLQRYFQDFLRKHGGDPKAECFIPTTVNDLLVAKQVKVKVLRSGESWFGVTYREDHPRVVHHIKELIESGSYPRRLWG
jgi:NDP-sugar pyrophosphorylase family protein